MPEEFEKISPDPSASSLRRALGLLRLLAADSSGGMRLKDIAAAAACTQPTAHRALQ
ncbi:helix-turn-helix domain-containing protein, partial [Elstera litoralis]|uniref:helix-turn-helix domain-containing protein n=1 Tax=Elstera litoralis TaxID=552518 RepID=UPI0012ED6F76